MLRLLVPNRSIADLSYFDLSDTDFDAWTLTSFHSSLHPYTTIIIIHTYTEQTLI